LGNQLEYQIFITVIFNGTLILIYKYYFKKQHKTLSLIINSIGLYLYIDQLLPTYREKENIFFELLKLHKIAFILVLVSAITVALGMGGKQIQQWISAPYKICKILTHPYTMILWSLLTIGITQGGITLSIP